LSVLLALSFVFGLQIQQVLAQAPLLDSVPTYDIKAYIQDQKSHLEDFSWNKLVASLKESAALSFRQGVKFLLNQIAQDTATWIASGGHGQKPLFVTEGWGAYLANSIDQAAGVFLDGMISGQGGTCECRNGNGALVSRPGVNTLEACVQGSNVPAGGCTWQGGTTGLAGSGGILEGLNLCAPSASIQIAINLGLTDTFQSRPKCTFSTLKNNWEQFITSKSFLPTFSESFNPGESDLSVALTLQTNLLSRKAEAKQNAMLDRLTNGGFSNVTKGTSDIITLPGTAVRVVWQEVFGTTQQGELSFTGNVIADAVDTFTKALAGGLLRNLLSQGFTGGSSGGHSNANLSNYEAQAQGEGVLGARARLAQDIRPNFSTPGRYDILSKLVSCDNDTNPGPTDCVINDNFRTAISQRLTVKEAIDQGLINGDAPFGFVGWNPQPIEPSYIDGVPYRSILILRKYRIVPVGWELAARYIQYFGQERITLRQLVTAYDTVPTTEKPNPFYHLVDPNWTLVPPDAFCKLQGPGPKVISQTVTKGTDIDGDGQYVSPGDVPPAVVVTRDANYCADEQTCVQRDANGNCQFYGYCTEEKRVWDFGKAQCQPQFSSCTTLSNTESGATVSYLLNTVDFNGCDAGSVGCKLYSTKDLGNNKWSTADADVLYLNGQVKGCDQKDDGCRAFIRTSNKVATAPQSNLLRNPSFETVVSEADSSAKGWLYDSTAVGIGTDTPFNGTRYLHSNVDNASLTQKAVLTGPLAGQTIGFSFYAKQSLSGDGRIAYSLVGSDASPSFTSLDQPLIDTWTRYSVTKTFAANDTTLPDSLNLTLQLSAGVDFDAVELTVGQTPTTFTTYGASLTRLKRAPDYRSKTDASYQSLTGDVGSCRPNGLATDAPDANADQAACTPYARYCLPAEVGCRSYTPANGTATVTAVSGQSCPTECVGFDTYTQTATFFEKPKFVDLIPATGQSCPAAAVGCDEFTNLDKETSGGEAREYYQQVQFCQKPGGTDSGTFYTWEGSDETGFQLRVFQLKKTEATNPSGFSTTAGSTGNDLAAPCTHINWSSDGISASCSDTSNAGDTAWRTCNENTYQSNPDCRQFYNETGQISYRLLSKTVSVTDSCHPLRKTDSNQQDCANSNGWWNTSIQVCIYQAVPNGGRQCSAAVAGCREYRGGTSASYRTVLNDTFEKGTAEWSGGQLSAVSSVVGGHSYEITEAVAEKAVTVNAGSSTSGTSGTIAPATYVVTFWARTQTGTATAAISAAISGNGVTNGTLVTDALLTSEWRQIKSDPVSIAVSASDAVTTLAITPSGTGKVFIDNIELKTTTDTHYLVKNSWRTPLSCYSNDAARQPFLGCQQYQVSDGSSKDVWQFGAACHAKVVGCEAVIDTQNTTVGGDAPFARSFNDAEDNSLITVPADSVDYLVNDPTKTCKTEAQGCQALGKVDRSIKANTALALETLKCAAGGSCLPDLRSKLLAAGYNSLVAKFDAGTLAASDAQRILRDALGDSATPWSSVYLKNNPDDYGVILCKLDQLQCSAFKDAAGSVYYFRDPGDQTCEYHTDRPVSGWYKKDSSATSPDCNRTITNTTVPRVQIAGSTAQEPIAGYVGTCPVQQNSCKEIVDPRSDGTRDLLINGSFIASDGTTPRSWTSIASPSTTYHYNQNLNTLTISSGGFEQSNVTLRKRTLYVLSAEAEAVSGSLAANAYLGIQCPGSSLSIQGSPYTFIEPTKKDSFDRFSVSFYVKNTDDVENCSVRVGQAHDLLPSNVSGEFATGAVKTRNVSLREASIHYELVDQLDTASCAGTVNNANCVLASFQTSYKSPIVNTYDADMSPLGDTKTPNGTTRTEYSCVGADQATGTSGICRGTVGLSCTADSDCQFQRDSNLLVKVQPSRECGSWLACKTARTVTRNSVRRNICLAVEGCEQLDDKGQCIRTTLDEPDKDLTYAASTVDQLKDRSGYSSVGFNWGNVCSNNSSTSCTTDADCGSGKCTPRLLQGYISPGYMEQVGQLALLVNANFEIPSTQGNAVSWVGWGNGQNFRVINNPVSAQSVGILYPREGRAFLEVNANHKVPDVPQFIDDSLAPNLANYSGTINVAGEADYILSADVNTVHFSGKSAGIRVFQYKTNGDLVPCNTAGTCKFLALLDTGAGFDWTTKVDKFTTDEDTRYIRLQFGWFAKGGSTENSSGNWYVDDIKLQPALEYRRNEYRYCSNNVTKLCQVDDDCGAGNTCDILHVDPDFPNVDYENGIETLDYSYASQSCRLYPEETSLSCQYNDDNGLRHRGKLGYCLTPDPQNSSNCLQWWPVDNIIGEDTEQDHVGYQGPIPLYQCLDVVDGWATLLHSSVGASTVPDYTGGKKSPAVPTDTFSHFKIDKHGQQTEYNGGKIDKTEKVVFDLYRNADSTTEGYAVGGLVDKPGKCDANYHAVDSATPLIHAGCEIRVWMENNKGGDGDDKYKIYVSKDLSSLYYINEWCESAACPPSLGNRPSPDQANNGWAEMWADVAWAVDSNGNRIPGPFRYLIIESLSSDDYITPLGLWARPSFSCNAVMQTVGSAGQNRAYASRVTPGSQASIKVGRGTSYESSAEDNYEYKVTTDSPPFGSVVPPFPADDPLAWDSTTFVGVQPLFAEPSASSTSTSQARAGGPYSCHPINSLLIGTYKPLFSSQCSSSGAMLNEIQESTYADGLTKAVKVLQQLFVQSYGVWEWQSTPDGYRYVETGSKELIVPTEQCGSGPTLNVRVGSEICGVVPAIPVVELSGAANTITKVGSVTLSFTAIANPEQEPIVRYIVDWGDGSRTVQTGLKFASHPSDQNPISLVHSYSYDDVARCVKEGSCAKTTTIVNGIYQVTPRVQILDNWGWCNGAYASTGNSNPLFGQTGYNELNTDGRGDCSASHAAAWQSSGDAITISQ